jgi:hypothetical protein
LQSFFWWPLPLCPSRSFCGGEKSGERSWLMNVAEIKVLNALDTLMATKSGEEVANLLKKSGIKGYSCDCYECPVANYLSKACGQKVLVSHDEGVVLTDGWKRLVELDGVVSEFVHEFDNGCYPDMEYD